MLRPPPISTLFPYTTLFRSGHHLREVRRRGDAFARPSRAHGPYRARRPGGAHLVHALATDARKRHLDRKSTRLNSSHVSISYAVFCLKKKKISKLCKHITTL